MAFSCASCGKSYATRADLVEHCRAKRHHHCHTCNRGFADGAALDQHQRDSPGHGNRPSQTNPVPAASTSSSALEQLRELAAAFAGKSTPAPPPPKGKGQVGCKKCSRVFKTAAALRQHEGDSPGHQQAPESVSGQAAHAAHAVAVSPLPHSSVRPTQEADTATPSASLLLPTNAKRSSCKKCSRAFGTAAALRQHQKDSGHGQAPAESASAQAAAASSQHGSLPPPKAKGCPDCKMCSRTFVSVEALSQHERDSPAHRYPPAVAASSVVLPASQHLSLRLAAKTLTQAAGTATSPLPTSSLPPTKAKACSDCNQCSRTFASAEALLQHKQDSPAHRKPTAKTNKPAEAASFVVLPSQHLPPPLAESLTRTTLPPVSAYNLNPNSHPSASSLVSTPKANAWSDCNQCSQTFPSAEALSQHERDSPAHRHPPAQPPSPAPAAETLTQAVPTAPTAITHRGNTYTHLAPAAQAALYHVLLEHCHAPSRLALERYPPVPLAPTATMTPTPQPSASYAKRKALVLDCEMVGGAGLADQVVALSAVDFFTGETLLDALVEPAGPVTQWRTAITGITRAGVAAAVAAGTALRGTREAVARLFELVDAETVLVGHSLWHDLKALGVAHGRIVDTGILAAEASGRFGERDKVLRPVGLKRLCRELAGLEIRAGGGHHESLEDVLATRELAIWCLTHPEEVKAWALKNWAAGTGANRGERGNKRGRGANSRAGATREGTRRHYRPLWDDDDEGHGDDGDYQWLRWEDVVDYEMWPKSPPDRSD